MVGHVDECEVRGWEADLCGYDRLGHVTPYVPGWARITEAEISGAALAPGVEFLYVPSATPVLEPDEVVHLSTPVTTIEPKETPPMLAPPHAALLLAPALPTPTPVVHLTGVALLDRIVGEIDTEVERLLNARAAIVGVGA